eukprot:CAMPEP_0115884624 /NCGR_PEP_ID=MMETSP0287-20121206/30222_1 /TAXON_ID=412157 /ORGANISM="Chrysochromulina rotalis, Strain UIO044" /LENGTH=30 /DNA_ID= /DNA_START= /DNA_END= /DNA_ORIENTATION=
MTMSLRSMLYGSGTGFAIAAQLTLKLLQLQ